VGGGGPPLVHDRHDLFRRLGLLGLLRLGLAEEGLELRRILQRRVGAGDPADVSVVASLLRDALDPAARGDLELPRRLGEEVGERAEI
jgi:hypothetical protein